MRIDDIKPGEGNDYGESERPFGLVDIFKAISLVRGGSMETIFRKLGEPSTWRGLIGMAGIAGISISPELTNQIVVVGGALMALIEIIRKEKRA